LHAIKNHFALVDFEIGLQTYGQIILSQFITPSQYCCFPTILLSAHAKSNHKQTVIY